MANIFDQFDQFEQPPPVKAPNPFDQFDAIESAPPQPQAPSYSAEPGLSDMIANRQGEDPTTTQVRREMAFEKERAKRERAKRREDIAAGKVPWWDRVIWGEGSEDQAKVNQWDADVTRSLAQGGLIGLGDELAAAARTPYEMYRRGTANPFTAYDYAKTRQNIEEDERKERLPYAANAMEILGGFGTGLGASGVASGLAKGVAAIPGMGWIGARPTLQQISKALANKPIVGSLADASVIGAGALAASGRSAEERAILGGIGAVGGPALAGAGMGVMGGGAWLAKNLGGNAIAGWVAPEQFTKRLLSKTLRESDKTVGDLRKGIRSAELDAQGDVWTVADEIGYPGQRLLAGAVQSPSMMRKTAYDFLRKRQKGQGERMGQALEENMGVAKTAKQAREELFDERDDTAKILWGEAREQAGPVDLKPTIAKIDEELNLKPYQAEAENRALLHKTPLERDTEEVQSLLREVYSSYPPPHPKPPPSDTKSVYYAEAHKRGLIPEIEQAAIDGLTPNQAVKKLGGKLTFFDDISTNSRDAFVRSVWDRLDIPYPQARIKPTSEDKLRFKEWREDRADQLAFAKKQAEEGEKAARQMSEEIRITKEADLDDDIAKDLRQIRSRLTDDDAGVTLTDFGLIYRTRKRIQLKIDTVGAKPPEQGGGLNERGAVLLGVKKELDAGLEKASAPFRAAADRYRADSKVAEAVELGEKAAQGEGEFARYQDNIRLYNGLTDREKAAFRSGYVSRLLGRVEKGAKKRNQADAFTSDKSEKELAAFAAPGKGERLPRTQQREETMYETWKESFLGSPTVRNANDDQTSANNAVSILASAIRGDAPGAFINALSRAQSYAKGYTPTVRENVIKALLQTPAKKGSKAEFERFRKGLEELEKTDASRRRAFAQALRGVYGGVSVGVNN